MDSYAPAVSRSLQRRAALPDRVRPARRRPVHDLDPRRRAQRDPVRHEARGHVRRREWRAADPQISGGSMSEPSHTAAHSGARVVVTHLDGGISKIVLNRPEKRNAMDEQARRSLIEGLEECRGKKKVII